MQILSKFCALVLSFVIVAWGQPARFLWFCGCAASFGYALFWKSLSEHLRKRARFWLGTLWFACVQLVQLSWMFSTQYHGIYIIFVALLLSLCLGMQFGALTVFVPTVRPMVLSTIWMLFEWARQHVLCGFSWNPVGLALTGPLWSLQSASLLGIYGLSFWVIWTNLRCYRASNFRGHLLWVGMACLPYLFGAFHLHIHSARMAKSPRRNIALVQTGLLPDEKFLWPEKTEFYLPALEQWAHVIDALRNVSPSTCDMIILPETSMPFAAETPLCSQKMGKEMFISRFGEEAALHFPEMQDSEPITHIFFARVLASLYGAPVLIGLMHEDPVMRTHANSAFLVTKEGMKGRYDKQILLPIAEALPFSWMRRFARFYGVYFFFEKGTRVDSLEGAALSICYEETFAGFMHKAAKRGAEVFVNLTNDGFFPFTKLAEQHFTHGLVRSVENGIPLLRACNTGVTAIVDSLGRTIARLGKKNVHVDRLCGVLSAELPMYHYPTLYASLGDFGMLSIGFFGLIAHFWSRVMRPISFLRKSLGH